MIKFYRKIRQNLLSEGKTGKYIKYAIGEIVLVVIGILIALSINNWNDHQKAVANSKVFLSEIAKDLVSDTLYLKNAIKKIEEKQRVKEWLLNKTSYQITDLDSIQMSFNRDYWDFYINDRTFQKIQNSNESKLVGFDSLNNSISKYYSTTKKRMEKTTAFEIMEGTKENEILTNLLNKVEIDLPSSLDQKFPSLQSKEKQDQIIFASFNFIRLRNDIKMEYMRNDYLLTRFRQCKKEADGLLSAIKETLQ